MIGIPTLTHSDTYSFRTNSKDPEKTRGVAYMEVRSRAGARGGRMWMHDERVDHYFFLATTTAVVALEINSCNIPQPHSHMDSLRQDFVMRKNERFVGAPDPRPSLLPPSSAGPQPQSMVEIRAGGRCGPLNTPFSHTLIMWKPTLEPTSWTRHGFCWTPSTILSFLGPSSTQSSMSSPAEMLPDVSARRELYTATAVS